MRSFKSYDKAYEAIDEIWDIIDELEEQTFVLEKSGLTIQDNVGGSDVIDSVTDMQSVIEQLKNIVSNTNAALIESV